MAPLTVFMLKSLREENVFLGLGTFSELSACLCACDEDFLVGVC